MGISTAIPAGDVSRTSGYQLKKGNFNNTTGNLQQQIVILGEANTANQGTILTTPVQITSAAQAGQTYGYGSPIHAIARILFPQGGTGVGAIPVWVMAQLAAGGSTGTSIVWTISGSATKAKTHYMNIAGRESVDNLLYAVNIANGDLANAIAAKYVAAINAVLGSPVVASQSSTSGSNTVATVVFSATSLTAGQTVTLSGLTYTSTGTTTQAQLAAAFANLSAGATTGPGTSTGTYSGTLVNYATGAVASGTTVTFTSTALGPVTTITQTGTGPAASITSVAGVLPVGTLTLTSKWTGLSSAALTAVVDINGDASGLTYALTTTTAGTSTPSIATALTQFQNNWYTTVINTYGVATLDALEALNGIPDPINPTGQYSPQIFMPFMAFFGNTDPVAANLVTITDANARISQVTNVLCPAPASAGMPYEAAANMVSVFCQVMQSTPHLTAAGQSYPDMPIPTTGLIGDLSNYNNRNLLKSKGCSTVTLVNGAYQIQDLVTTYHPTGEVPLIFNECRYLNLDWNVKYGYNILQIQNVNDKVLVADGQVVDVTNAIRPSDWKAILYTYFDTLAKNCVLNIPAFSKASLSVEIDPDNPNRFNTIFSYKRTGTSEIESTTVTVGF